MFLRSHHGGPRLKVLYWSSFLLQPLYDKAKIGDLPIGMELNNVRQKPPYAFMVLKLSLLLRSWTVITHIITLVRTLVSLRLHDHHIIPMVPYDGQNHTCLILA